MKKKKLKILSSPKRMIPGKGQVVVVEGGTPPYTWELSNKEDFYLLADKTLDGSNVLVLKEIKRKTSTQIFITDSEGEENE